jgi:hypothetical protein
MHHLFDALIVFKYLNTCGACVKALVRLRGHAKAVLSEDAQEDAYDGPGAHSHDLEHGIFIQLQNIKKQQHQMHIRSQHQALSFCVYSEAAYTPKRSKT